MYVKLSTSLKLNCLLCKRKLIMVSSKFNQYYSNFNHEKK